MFRKINHFHAIANIRFDIGFSYFSRSHIRAFVLGKLRNNEGVLVEKWKCGQDNRHLVEIEAVFGSGGDGDSFNL